MAGHIPKLLKKHLKESGPPCQHPMGVRWHWDRGVWGSLWKSYDQNGQPSKPPSPEVSGDEPCLLPGPRALRETAIWHREGGAEANWHGGQCHAPAGLRAEPPANWHQGRTFFLLVQLFCMDFVVPLPVSFMGEVLTHALGTVCSHDSLPMAFLEKDWAEEAGCVRS